MKTLKSSEEFVTGKHNIVWMSNAFRNLVKDNIFEPRPMPTITTLERNMTDEEIEKEITKGQFCTLGDIITFMDNAPKECKDGWANIFYFPSSVANALWNGDDAEWYAFAYDRDDFRWNAGDHVLSPATDTPILVSDTLSLESLSTRVAHIEEIIKLHNL